MKVYTFTHHTKPPQRPLQSRFNLGGSNIHKKARHQTFKTLNLMSFLENKLASQIVAIVFLTVAVFIAVQGLFGSTDATVARAAGLEDNVKLIVNYNTTTPADKNSVDNSKLVDAPDTTLLGDSPQATTNLQPVSTSSVTTDKPASISKK
jgi:hypothetical protein